jgi:polyhydroxybutyrate depolymerase
MSNLLVVLFLAAAVLLLVGPIATRLGLRDRDNRSPLPWRQMKRRFVSTSLRIDGLERFCLLYIPTRARPARPMPLVLAFHGGGGNPRGFARMTKLHYLAETEGFLLAYPAGSGRRPRRGLTWNAGGDSPENWAERHRIDDVGFVKALIDELSRVYSIDRRRIFAIGASKGGMLAYHLACTMSETFAAVGVVAGSMITQHCTPRHPVAIYHVHGENDQNVPLQGGAGRLTARGNAWPPVEGGLDFWRRYNGCTDEKRETYRDDETTCWRYTGSGNGDVEFCLVRKGGHAWPGSRPRLWQRLFGVRVNRTFPTNRMAWRFFLEHAKPDNTAARSIRSQGTARDP